MEVEKVIEHFGDTRKTAEALGLGYQTIWQWRKNGKIPLDKQYKIQVVTGGEFIARIDNAHTKDINDKNG